MRIFFRQNLNDNRLCKLLIKPHNLQKNILFYYFIYFILLNQKKSINFHAIPQIKTLTKTPL